MGKEPTVILNAIAEIVRAVVPTLIIFGFIQWTDDQVAQIMLLISVVVGAIATVISRSQVVPVETASAQIKVATEQPAGTSVARVIEITKERANES